jgi:hypothetical protein
MDLIATPSHYLAGQMRHEQSALAALPTSGKNALRVSVMAYVSCTTGVNCSILGYMSRGEMVPEVMTTLLKRSKTGFMAREGSRQLPSSSARRTKAARSASIRT